MVTNNKSPPFEAKWRAILICRKRLLQNLQVVQNGQNQTDGEIKTNQTADCADDSTDHGDVDQNADQNAGNGINGDVDEDIDYQSGDVLLGLEGQREEFSELVHEIYLQFFVEYM